MCQLSNCSRLSDEASLAVPIFLNLVILNARCGSGWWGEVLCSVVREGVYRRMSDRGRNDGDVKRNSVSSGRPASGSNASPRNAVKEERIERNERDRTGRTSSNERFFFLN
ncbi:unnamed protein product [Acanthocheilonema viteae]|uniref:Uncharacterized protein n=1 Tax=Acanthocheilonema viteae TaxID=6277 RepID=A0A498SDW1_ACAVI|nr:unnamed protein product [Acanthocheilonema viteae]